jgi:hypothetical protein
MSGDAPALGHGEHLLGENARILPVPRGEEREGGIEDRAGTDRVEAAASPLTLKPDLGVGDSVLRASLGEP